MNNLIKFKTQLKSNKIEKNIHACVIIQNVSH